MAGAPAAPRRAQPRAPTSSPSSGSTSSTPSAAPRCRSGCRPPAAARRCGGTRRAAGHRPAAARPAAGRGLGQPQPGRVRVLRAVPRLPRHGPDHRRPVPGVRRRRREHPHPLAHRPRSRGGGRRQQCGSTARASRAGAGRPAGDLYVNVHVTPHRLFGRSEKNADDLTLTVPVTFPELALGCTHHGAHIGRARSRCASRRAPAAGARSGSAGAGWQKATTGRPARHGGGGGARSGWTTRRRAPCSPTPRRRRVSTRGPTCSAAGE